MREAIALLGIATAGCSLSSAATSKKTIDQKADAILREMSKQLATAHAMQFDADHTLEVVTKQGEKIQFIARSRVAMERPDKARSDRVGAIVDASLYYDGKTVTIFGKKLGLYATAPAPSTLDEALEFARDTLDLEAPAADMLYSDPYTGLMEDVTSGIYIGLEPIGDRSCHHLAFREPNTDWQIWIEDSARSLPCRYVVTSTDIRSSPQFAVSFSNWNLAPQFPAGEFEFTPPNDAIKIDFVAAKAIAQKQKRSKQ
jgi:hypothetical protein